MAWFELITQLLVGLATLIPLVINLIKYVRLFVKERNWSQLVQLLMVYINQAEKEFETGADRKKWVMDMIKASAATINYEYDEEKISTLIDEIVLLSKKINVN